MLSEPVKTGAYLKEKCSRLARHPTCSWLSSLLKKIIMLDLEFNLFKYDAYSNKHSTDVLQLTS